MKDIKKNPNTKLEKVSKLTKEDGQLEKKRIKVKKRFKPLFGKDVNDPSERGHD